jgi:bacterioferritin-associated ferredoxin
MTEKKREVILAPRPREVCICFHVSQQKLEKHVRLNKSKVASRLSECYGAGTGCGWCIPFLEKIYEIISKDPKAVIDLGLSEDEYRARRKEFHQRINASRMKDERGDGEE